jgi:hypothetical protein
MRIYPDMLDMSGSLRNLSARVYPDTLDIVGILSVRVYRDAVGYIQHIPTFPDLVGPDRVGPDR